MKIFIALTMVLFSSLLIGQESGVLKGTILDEEVNNEPLMFANVLLKDTDIVVETNLHGNFEIDGIVPGSYTLLISYPGYEDREVAVEVNENKVSYIQKGLRAKRITIADVSGNEGTPVDKATVSDAGKSAIRR